MINWRVSTAAAVAVFVACDATGESIGGKGLRNPLLGPLKGWRLAYAAAGRTHATHLFVADADGRHRRQIDHLRGEKHQPNWSPDGTEIAFRWLPKDEDHTPLMVIRADGSSVLNLTRRTGLRGWSPSWSPDGKRLVAAATPKAGAPPSLYVMKADGSSVRRITPPGREAQYAAWSPNGERIAFTYVVDGGFDLFSIRPDGSDLQRLTKDGSVGQNNWPMWSPDGRRIAWGRADSIWMMNSDGSHKRLVTTAGGVPGTWAPGPFITFNCALARGRIGICVVRDDGSGLTTLLGAAEAGFPGWKPKAR
jgi:TolB protein